MTIRSFKKGIRPILLVVVLTMVAVLAAAPVQAGGFYFKAAGGISGMAMDDINNSNFSFSGDPDDGYNFPDLKSGFSMSFGLGADLSKHWAMGFNWNIQHAHTSGNDGDVDGTLKLDANIFMLNGYWLPMRGQKFSVGAGAGIGIVGANGTTKVERGNVDYGEGKTSGTNVAYEIFGTAEYLLSKSTALQLTAGWRVADVKTVKYNNATLLKEDGSNMSLDYTGYTLMLGVVFRMGSDSGVSGSDLQ